MNKLVEMASKRHSQYSLKRMLNISDDRLVEIVEGLLQTVPSAFNNQSQKAVILFNDNHDKLWDITLDELKKVAGDNPNFKDTEKKIAGFKNSYGTILFYTDTNETQKLIDNFPAYADNFPLWAHQENGMLQFAVWTALADENVGASLQHYNPLIDDKVKESFNIPNSWKLLSQMPFGDIDNPVNTQEKYPIEEKLIIKK